ncbi:CoA-acylating methylmalonate-semialdehyde dehydrogenase [Thaumasiovibrio subtropicus]|uniref:CoA-acylating methylmalonate-semialdehyde dehydrogenase n=1 Tax=Thaumasiovibrio subtropicus TaxID=1891207 RepID=UPI000B363C0A|nr:CoA-acylating methylmalonate-semialdehyde dehydrogenase [Thaumasiovibrio subtropicus]
MSDTHLHPVPIYVDGEWRQSTTTGWQPVVDPTSAETIATVPLCSKSEVERAVSAAHRAFLQWRNTPVSERARVMLAYQHLLKAHQSEIAAILASETGKVMADAMGDVWRGIEVVEHATAVAPMMMGEHLENVAAEIDSYSLIQPLGVCVGITPFNFPAMIPLWMFPLAVACGNGFVLKPSERVPLTAVKLIELFYQAGAPQDIVQLVHGGVAQAQCLYEHPDVKAVSFVGSVDGAQSIYRGASQALKRVQALGGAKNHLVVMPDANKEEVINAIVGASVGAAGQRCMAISVVVWVGKSAEWIADVVAKMAEVKPGLSEENAAFGPLISAQSKQRVCELIASGIEAGAECLLDGREFVHPTRPKGFWLAPTIFDKVTPEMAIYQQEIFGPVLLNMRAENLPAAMALINANPCGNGTSIFTSSGQSARQFQHGIEVGQVGINVPIPVPLPFFSFTGWKKSFYGDLHIYGKQAVRFYTETKTVTSRWFDDENDDEGDVNMTIQLR